MPSFLTTAQHRQIAYSLTQGEGLPVVFLSGFRSDMAGTKAVALEAWARAAGRTFLRFDYSGHGQSSGAFEEGAIGDWVGDARAVLDLLPGRVLLVGSSMGGWISLLIARDTPGKVAGLVTIAAAPDFTQDGMWDGFTEQQRAELSEQGRVLLPSDCGAPYVITRRLIEDGRDHLVLRTPLDLPFPVRFLQGTADADVSVDTALRLLTHATGDDLRLTLVKGADHRFSTDDCLQAIARAVEDVTARVG